MVQDLLHRQIVHNLPKIQEWFRALRVDLDVPVYSSYDIREAEFKVTNVDANIYPAGFNNICRTDREHAGELFRHYIERHYGSQFKKLLVLSEEHTQNPYYWDNVRALLQIISDAGLEGRVAFPRSTATGSIAMKTATGEMVEAWPALVQGGEIQIEGYKPDLVVSNNDFSEFYAEWGNDIKSAVNPPRELGWYRRKKSTYFKHYNDVATQFAKLIEVDPWLLTVETELFSDFDMADDQQRQKLAVRTDLMLGHLRERYKKLGIHQEPFAFIKNNSGTYGLAVMRVGSGQDVMELNYKARKKMKAAKGGRDVEEVILQEGVPSIVRAEGVTAEPAVYMIGCQLAGAFLRTHAEKDETESLNSPGAIYKRLCVSDLKVSVEGHPLENVYGWVAKLGILAIGLESREMGVTYLNYKRMEC